jgi:threonyl-tRNA synthetase
MITLTFPDNTKRQFNKGITGLEIVNELYKKEKEKIIAIKLNDKALDLSFPIEHDGEIKFLGFDSEEGRDIFNHSASHIMAQAIMRLYPDSKLTIGPTVEEGFYYDIDHSPFTPEELPKIEEEMKKIVDADYKVSRKVLTKHQALELFKNNSYKTELINEMEGEISAYEQGDFVDLCRGPHVPSTGYVRALKLTKISSSYWRADSSNKSLQRIYGIAFPEKKQLDDYLKLIEEAEKRNHRRIGRELDLFSIHDEGPGFIFFHPKGVIIWNELVQYWRELHEKNGYQEIRTPIILSRSLWERSGHWDHYKENMYFTKIDEADYAVKPMNCPGSILTYKEKVHSYREFPLRLAELGLVHRHELSGVISGLFRVRAFTQDDAHIFITPEQIESEVINVYNLIDMIYKTFGFEYRVELSTMPEKAMGAPEIWEMAENSLKKALENRNIAYKLNHGDGAFYGPKIDFHIKDAMGRTWQCATIQLDFFMPEKFELTYDGIDGRKHRPVMIHRVAYGALERFIGILIEHYAGKFPLWLNPRQVRILCVADRFEPYARVIQQQFSNEGIRVEVDARAESIPYKVRDAQLLQFNYILVVGEREVDKNTVTVRTRDNKVIGAIDKDKFLKELLEEIKEKK